MHVKHAEETNLQRGLGSSVQISRHRQNVRLYTEDDKSSLSLFNLARNQFNS